VSPAHEVAEHRRAVGIDAMIVAVDEVRWRPGAMERKARSRSFAVFWAASAHVYETGGVACDERKVSARTNVQTCVKG
jgi:hypothetical protein